MAAPVVEVVGLKALARDLARASDPHAGELLVVMREAGRRAAQPVATAVAAAYPNVTGTLSGSVRVTASRSGAAVRVGKASVPYAGPVDFGGYPGDRPFLPNGRYLYPTAEGLAESAATLYNEELQKGLDSLPWTNTTDSAGSVHD